jgi:hypothetical protein
MTPDSNGRFARTARRLTVALVALALVTQVAAAGVAASPGVAGSPTDLAGDAGSGGPLAGVPAATATDRIAPERPPDHRTDPYGTGIPVLQTGLATQSTASDPIELTYVVDRMPGDPNVSVTANVDLPSNANEFTVVELPEGATVAGRDGFSRTSRGDWRTTRSSASLTYEMAFDADTPWGLEATDQGSWAFTGQPVYGVRFSYRYTGEDPGYDATSRSASGEAVGSDFLFWGPHRVETVSDAGTPVEIVVPDAASYSSEVAATLRSADRNLGVGNRGELTRAFVVPDPVREGGRTDSSIGAVRGFWVGDGARPDTANNVWVHEYVHTRQTFRPDTGTRWFLEGSAEYFAAYLTTEEGRVDFGTFHDSVTTERYRDAVLADRSDWAGTTADYDKGAHVLAALDAKIRAESGGSGTLEDVFATVNDDAGFLTIAEFEDAVESAAGTSLDGWIDQYVGTSAIPPVPNDPAAFGFGAAKTSVDLAVAANATTVGAGDDVAVTVTRADTGDPVDATVSVDGSSYSTGGDGTVTVDFDRSGTYAVTATKADTGSETYDSASLTVTVERPGSAEFAVGALSLPDSVVAGDGVPVSASVENVGEERGDATVRFEVDGGAAATRTVTLSPGESTTVSATLSPGAGTHDVAVVAGQGQATGSVTVDRPATFAVREFTAPDAAASGDTVEVEATVENTGDVAGSATVTYRFDRSGDGDFDDGGDVERTAAVDLGPGESARVRFSVSLSGLSADSYGHSVSTPDDDGAGPARVRTLEPLGARTGSPRRNSRRLRRGRERRADREGGHRLVPPRRRRRRDARTRGGTGERRRRPRAQRQRSPVPQRRPRRGRPGHLHLRPPHPYRPSHRNDHRRERRRRPARRRGGRRPHRHRGNERDPRRERIHRPRG